MGGGVAASGVAVRDLVGRLDRLALAWAAYGLLVLGIGLGGYWSAPLTFDEATYYVPAIQYFAERLPLVPIHDYPFAGPPGGLLLQAVLHKLIAPRFGDLRFLSLALALLAGAVVCWWLHRYDRTTLGAIVFLMVACFPFYLNYTFQLKHHALALGTLLSGYVCWDQYRTSRSNVFLGMAVACLTLAALTSQFAAPMALLLLWDGLREAPPQARRLNVARVAVTALPLLVLAALVWLWGGFQPPLYRGSLLEAEVGARVHFGQVVAGLLSLGVWVFPVTRPSRQRVVCAALLSLPAVALVHATGMFGPGNEFFETLVGPVSHSLRFITGNSYGLSIWLAGVLVAFGGALLLPGDGSRHQTLFRRYAVLYIAMLTLLPYYFESYWTFLIVPGYLVLAPALTSVGAGVATRGLQILIALSGIAYTLVKLVESKG